MKNKKFKFNVGDRVICHQSVVPSINGKMGTVVAVGNFYGNEYLVEMDEASADLHDCHGLIPSGRGWMFCESMLRSAEEETEESGIFPLDEIEAGYLLKIHDDDGSEYYMTVNYNCRNDLGCSCPEPHCYWNLNRFDDNLIYRDARIIAIYGRSLNKLLLANTPEERELLWERKEETKAKKMTVTEVCKALGYDIEIVKE
jgi:hypothetical protein